MNRYDKRCYKIALGVEVEEPKESLPTTLHNNMMIQLNKPLLIGNRNYAVGDVLDLEVSGDRKKEMVEKGLAHYYTPPAPHKETASLKPPAKTASRHKGKSEGDE